MNKKSVEVNFDGIVGPTHCYSGLAYGNIASINNQQKSSNPKQAALQGLKKMKLLMDRGIYQAVLPPQERPDVPMLRRLGFLGSDQEVLSEAFKKAPELFFACSSSSSMWTANAATVTPSSDSFDQKVHFTPANLTNKFHRSIETYMTGKILKNIFPDVRYFTHHPALPAGNVFADEGAANQSRFCEDYGKRGVNLAVFGRSAFGNTPQSNVKYPARQTYEAATALARIHQVPEANIVYAQQNPLAIDAGVFHNDVISTGNQNLFLYHEKAFVDCDRVIKELQSKMARFSDSPLICIKVAEKQISLEEAVTSYIFNSQLVTLNDGKMLLLAPNECLEMEAVRLFLEEIKADTTNPIKEIQYINLRESMSNGGGPACLRLRVVLTPQELEAVLPQVLLTDSLYEILVNWVEKHYRDRLLPQDLQDYQLLKEGRKALEELMDILKIGPI